MIAYLTNLPIPTKDIGKIQVIDSLMPLVRSGKYPGDTRKKSGTRRPVYTQRTSFLYYSRKYVGDPMIWTTLAMGTVSNLHEMVSDKKQSLIEWEMEDPGKFQALQEYLPMAWTDEDKDIVSSQVNQNGIYVFKPSEGYDGNGIQFIRGSDVGELVENTEESSWIIQDFINPFLYQNKKTHFRVISLVVIRPNGVRESYLYKQMKMMFAPKEFHEELLFDKEFMESDESTNMLITNLRTSRELYFKDPNTIDSEFVPWDYVLDVEESIGTEKYEDFLSKTATVQGSIFDILENVLECKPTGVSIYSDGCFHILASDMAFDKNDNPYFLEINAAMGINGLWKPHEVREFSDGVAAIVNPLGSPYEAVDEGRWMEI